jgi:hypothetical protein
MGALSNGTSGPFAGIAVDDMTGDVLAAGSDVGVHVYGPGGPAATPLMSFGDINPYRLAVDQRDGAVYVSSRSQDEHQFLHFFGVTGDTYTLTFEGQTTAPIAIEADDATIRAALEALPAIPPHSIGFDYASGPQREFIFEGPLGETDVGQISIDRSGLEGELDGVNVETFANGYPGAITKFVPDDRLHPTTYTEDPAFTEPVRGTDPHAGELCVFRSPTAVDPRNGDLLIADSCERRVMRFSSEGAFIGSFDGSGSPGGAFVSLADITVAPDGEIYVIRDRDGVSGSTIERFSPDGTGGTPIGGDQLQAAHAIAFDPRFGNLLIARYDDSFLDTHLAVYHDGTLIERDRLGGSAPFDLAVDGGSSRYVYVLTAGAAQVFSPLSIPTLAMPTGSRTPGEDPATLHLSGSVDPLGRDLAYRFEYSGDGGATWSSTPQADAGDDEGPVSVGAEPQIPNASEYKLRLVVSGSGAEKSSEIRTIHSPPATTLSADHYNLTSATLRGTVDPEGLSTGYRFEYGTTEAYASQTPTLDAGEGSDPLAVSRTLTGLQPGATYHFRIVAENAVGSRVGEDRRFTTLALPMGLGLRPLVGDEPAVARPLARRCGKGRHLRKVKSMWRCRKVHRRQGVRR